MDFSLDHYDTSTGANPHHRGPVQRQSAQYRSADARCGLGIGDIEHGVARFGRPLDLHGGGMKQPCASCLSQPAPLAPERRVGRTQGGRERAAGTGMERALKASPGERS